MSENLNGLDPSLPTTITESRKLLEEVENFLNSETYLAFQREFKEQKENGLKGVVNLTPFSIGDFLLREQAIGVLAKLPEQIQWFELRRQIIMDHIEALSALLKDTTEINHEH